MVFLCCLFAYTCSLTLLIPLFHPFVHLLFFAPFLVVCFYRCSLIACLWWALICGLVIDLFSSDTRLGIYTINYCFTTLCLYHYKFLFFEDRLSTLPIMSFIFTFLSNLTQISLLAIIGKPFLLSWYWFFNDLLSMPFQGALYTLVAFIVPSVVLLSLKQASKRVS